MRLRLTEHALRRYRERANPAATAEEVETVLLEGEFHSRWAGRVVHACDGWIVTKGGAFPLVVDGTGVFTATTFVPKHRRLKADRRAWREWQREERLAA